MDESESSMRNHIVTATRKLIAERGIAHITTKQIAHAAGCAEGTIFRYFARKDDLLLAAVMANFPSLRESLLSLTGGTPRQRLYRLGLTVLRFFEQIVPAAVAVLSDAELTRRHRDTVRDHHGGPQRLYAAVIRFLEAEQARGALHAEVSPVHMASTLLGPCFFRVFTRLSLGKNALELTDEAFVAGIVDTLWKGVRPAIGKPRRQPPRTPPSARYSRKNGP